MTSRDGPPTRYRDVTALGYTPGGAVSFDVEIGDVEPGTTSERTVETEQFPSLLTASPGDVTTPECVPVDAGAELRAYAGRYPHVPVDLGQDFRERVENALDGVDGAHVWLPYGSFRAGEAPPPTEEAFVNAKCFQRTVAGRNHSPPPDFSTLQNATTWLERDEDIGFTLYRWKWQSANRDAYAPADAVPERIRALFERTDWESMGRHKSVTRSVDLAEWKRLVGILEGADGPTFPSCGSDQCTPDHMTGGHCRRDDSRGYYSMELGGGDRSGVKMYYWWEGIRPDPLKYPSLGR